MKTMKRRIPNIPKMMDRLTSGGSRPHHVHGRRNPAGSKLVRKFYRTALGAKATAEKAWAWHMKRRDHQS